MKEKRIIGYIENGIVIDHIPYGDVWKIADLLGINQLKNGRVSLGEGYESSKIDKKGVLKIESMKLSRKQLNLIALIAENTSVSLIEDGKIQKKIDLKIPNVLENIIQCPNDGCVSNKTYESVPAMINYSVNKGFSCQYCNHEFDKKDLKLIY
jgi:aspartate carbamoyltransferase regulatory subunit